MKYGCVVHAILKYFSDFIYICVILCINFFLCNKDYFQHYIFIDTAFYAVNITMPVRLKHISAVGLGKGLVKV